MKLTKRHLALLTRIVETGYQPHYTQHVQTMRDLKSAGLIEMKSDNLDNYWWSSTELAVRALINPQLTYPDRVPRPNGARLPPARQLPENKRLVLERRQITLSAEDWVFLEEYITDGNPATAIKMLVKNARITLKRYKRKNDLP